LIGQIEPAGERNHGHGDDEDEELDADRPVVGQEAEQSSHGGIPRSKTPRHTERKKTALPEDGIKMMLNNNPYGMQLSNREVAGTE
jgi:hypothetical protein